MHFTPLLLPIVALAIQDYVAERDPPAPAVGSQYRLVLRTPHKSCASYRKVMPELASKDLLVSETKKDETGAREGCRYGWLIQAGEAPGAMRFAMEHPSGAKESFEVPASVSGAGNAPMPSSKGEGIPSVANESGTGPARTAIKGSLKLPGLELSNPKSADPGTGK